MTKEELIEAINEMDPSYQRLKMDLSKFTEAELQKTYDRKKNAPAGVKERMKGRGWYSSFVPQKRVAEIRDTEYDYKIPVYEAEEVREEKVEKTTGVALTGFDALDKERMK